MDVISYDYQPTQAIPGSAEKLEVLRLRAEHGFPLWHSGDRVRYDNLTAAEMLLVRPNGATLERQHAKREVESVRVWQRVETYRE